jgi:hypothetical protein
MRLGELNNSHVNLFKILYGLCQDPSLGLATKSKGMERWGPRMQLGSHIHILGNAKECEGMSPHTPKWAPI